MVSSLDIREVLDMITRTVSMLMDNEGAAVMLLDESRKTLALESSHGLSCEYESKCRAVKVEGDIAHIIDGREPYIITSLKQACGIPFQPNLLREGFRCMVIVPIVYNDEALGSIATFSKKKRTFIESEIQLLQAFASQAAIAIKNAMLHKSVHLHYFNTINTLSLAIEARDPYTRGHAERVTNYSVSLGKALNLSKDDLSTLRYAGKIHDIGKIAISDTVLLKPGRLTPAERAQVELHSIKGVEIISHLKFLEPGKPIIRHHHERFDGGGYPDGLKREEIPIGARILTVADSFDAMTSERPYRSSLAIEEAIDDLRRNSGTQFDPQIVDAFIKIIARGLPQ